MKRAMNKPADALPFTIDGVRTGVRLCLPFVPGYFLLGAAVGALAAQKGLTFAEALLFASTQGETSLNRSCADTAPVSKSLTLISVRTYICLAIT